MKPEGMDCFTTIKRSSTCRMLTSLSARCSVNVRVNTIIPGKFALSVLLTKLYFVVTIAVRSQKRLQHQSSISYTKALAEDNIDSLNEQPESRAVQAVMRFPGLNIFSSTSFFSQPLAPQVKYPEILPTSTKIKEETSSDYDPKHFYPVRIGQTFNDRYHVVGKLGAGDYSTVWLVKDIGR